MTALQGADSMNTDTFDHAQASRDVLASCTVIQSEVRLCYGEHMTPSQCVDRVIAARWPHLTERAAYAAAIRHYELPAVSA